MAYTNRFRDNAVPTQQYLNGVLISTSFNSLPGVRSGTKVNDHKSKIAAGLNAGSAYSNDGYEVLEIRPGHSTLSWLSSPNARITRESMSGVRQPPATFNHLSTSAADAERNALTGILKRVRAQKLYFEGATFVGELGEAIHGIRHPADALRKQLDKYFLSLENRKRKVLRLPVHKRQAEWGKAVSGSWLEVQFGWKPLISDTKAIAETIGKLMFRPPPRDRISFQSRERVENVGNTSNFVYVTSNLVGYQNTNTVTERTVRYICGMETNATIASSAVSGLIDACGFNPSDFVPALWEVTPWSFVVDYFTNVGDIIEAAVTDTKAVKWIVRTERVYTVQTTSTQQVSSQGRLTALNPGYREVMNSFGTFGSVKLARRTVVRTIPASLGIPTLKFTHPGESFGKMANLLALAAQRRKGLNNLDLSTNSPKFSEKHRKIPVEYTHS